MSTLHNLYCCCIWHAVNDAQQDWLHIVNVLYYVGNPFVIGDVHLLKAILVCTNLSRVQS